MIIKKGSNFNLCPYLWPGSLREHRGEFTMPLGIIDKLMVRSNLLVFAPPRASHAFDPDPRLKKAFFDPVFYGRSGFEK